MLSCLPSILNISISGICKFSDRVHEITTDLSAVGKMIQLVGYWLKYESLNRLSQMNHLDRIVLIVIIVSNQWIRIN